MNKHELEVIERLDLLIGFALRNEQQQKEIMTSLQTLSLAITNLQTAVALIPSGAPVTGDPGASAAQVIAAAAQINAATAILTADVSPAGGIPAAPSGVIAWSNGGGNVTLTFPPVSGATSYTVEQSLTTGAEAGPGVSVPAPAPATPPSLVSYQATGLTVGTAYFFEVFSVNAAGTSVASAEVTVIA